MSVSKHAWNPRNISTQHQKSSMPLYERVLNAALSEMPKAQPFHSDFKVGCAILNVTTGRLFRGSNSEYGAGYGKATSRSLHAEVSATDKARGKFRKGEPAIIAVIGDAPGPVTPCGDCRDFLRTFFPIHTEILAANTQGDVDILTLDALLPNNFRTVSLNPFSDYDHLLMHAASHSFKRGLVIELGLREGAAVWTSNEKIYMGARVDSACYHPTTAIASAISNAVAAGNVDIVAMALIPNKVGLAHGLSGLERQFIYGIFDVLGRVKTGRILIATPELDMVMSATPEELLPYGFSMATIGKDNEIRALIENLRARQNNTSRK